MRAMDFWGAERRSHRTNQTGRTPIHGREMYIVVPIIAFTLTMSIVPSTAAKLPAKVQSAINEQIKSCDEKVQFEKGFLTRRDINDDGKNDYILDYEHFICGENRINCGASGGCLTQVFASLPDGKFVLALEGTVRGLKFKTVRGRPTAFVELHGTFCGKYGYERCEHKYYWNGKTFVGPHGKFDWGPSS